MCSCVFFSGVCVSVCVYSDVHTADLGPQARVDEGPVNIVLRCLFSVSV